MKFKLLNKLFGTTLAIFLVSLIITSTLLNFVISNFFSKEKYSALEKNCIAVSQIVKTDFNSANFKRNIYNVIRAQNAVNNTDIFICDNNGLVVICGCDSFAQGKECAHTQHILSNEILSKGTNDNFKQISTMDGIYAEPYFVYGVKITNFYGEDVGFVFSTASTESIRGITKKVSKIFLYTWIVPIILMCVAFYFSAYKFTKPLKKMSTAAKCMAKGDFSHRIEVKGNDELSELAASFNYMSDSLSKLETMRRSFIGNVSHELRTPMTTIAGFIDGILDGTIKKDEHKHYLDIVASEVNRLSRVIEAMFSLAKLESGQQTIKLTDFDIRETIFNVVISRELQIEEKNLQIIGLDKIESQSLSADNDLIYQVIYNLVDNAVKFTEENGYIQFNLIGDANKVYFSIKNSGEGIPQNELNSIFERFYKVDRSRSTQKNCTGLGLYIAKTIINLHNGEILAESKENDYTIFKVILPRNSKRGDLNERI